MKIKTTQNFNFINIGTANFKPPFSTYTATAKSLPKLEIISNKPTHDNNYSSTTGP